MAGGLQKQIKSNIIILHLGKSRDTVSMSTQDKISAPDFGLSHRRRDGQHPTETGHVILFADNSEENENYGPEAYEVDQNVLGPVPQWVIDWYADSDVLASWAGLNGVEDRDEILEQAESELNPENIVESAGFWDDNQLVSDFWQANEARLVEESIIGFRLHHGAVVFDSSSSPEAIRKVELAA